MKKRTRKKKSVYTHQTHTPQHGIFFFLSMWRVRRGPIAKPPSIVPLPFVCFFRIASSSSSSPCFLVGYFSFFGFFVWFLFIVFVYPPPTAVLYSYTINLPMLRFANKKKNWDCLLKEKNGKKKKVQGMFVKSGCFGNIWESRRKTVDMWMCLCVCLCLIVLIYYICGNVGIVEAWQRHP